MRGNAMSSTPKGLERHHAPITDAYPSSKGALSDWELSLEQRASFDERGYLSPIQLLESAEVNALRLRLDAIGERIHELRPLLYEVEASWLERPDEVVLHFLGAWRVEELFHDLAFHPGVTVPLAQLLGVDRLRFWHDQVFWKPAGHPGIVPWHQDWSYWQRTTPENHITMFISLDDSDEGSGCLQVIPGSHRWGPLPAADFGGALDQVKAHLSESQLADFHPTPLPLCAGEASIHHSSTIHGSLANRSERPRRGFVLNFMGPDTRCADGETPMLPGAPLLELGALIEGDYFPIVLDRTPS